MAKKKVKKASKKKAVKKKVSKKKPMAKPPKKAHLHRSSKNKIIAGVCGGLGEYYGVDPTIIRLIWVLATLLTGLGLGLLAYIIAWIVMPKD